MGKRRRLVEPTIEPMTLLACPSILAASYNFDKFSLGFRENLGGLRTQGEQVGVPSPEQDTLPKQESSRRPAGRAASRSNEISSWDHEHSTAS